MAAAGHRSAKGFKLAVNHLDPRLLPFIPRNEMGVVFAFALVAEKLGFEVASVQVGFPDCQARIQRKRVRIEFEYRSKNFREHQHPPRQCDLVVCWKHDWPALPTGLAALELRKLFGQARDHFMVAYREDAWGRLPDDREPSGVWSVPASAGIDDLLLVYRPGTPGAEGAVTDVFSVQSAPIRHPQGWHGEPDWMAEIARVAWLGTPIPFSRLKELGAHGGIESRPRRTKQWPRLYKELTEHARPSHSLRRYAPDRS